MKLLSRQRLQSIIPYTTLMAVFTAVASLFLSAVIFSYSAQDSSLFFYSSAASGYANWGGFLGAHLASALFFLFGWGAYWLPLAGFMHAYHMFFGEEKMVNDRSTVMLLMVPLVSVTAQVLHSVF